MNTIDKTNLETNSDSNVRKFKDDRLFNLINREFTSLKDEDVKRNNEILHKLLNEVISTIKDKNDWFKLVFLRIVFVGSYYKGTKVGKPEEFDLNLIIQLPVNYDLIEFEGDVPGYTKIKLTPDCYKSKWKDYNKILGKWVNPEGHLNQEEFRASIESVFKDMPKVATVGNEKYELNLRKSGPAFSLCVKGPTSVNISVDLVPVLEFKTQPPVPGDFRAASWFVVPKTKRDLNDANVYWRMSFYDFEKAMMKKCGSLKPVVKLLKKLRDTADWKIIASYYIETITLHRIRAMEDSTELQKFSTTELFVDMLGKLKDACETHKIINFWDETDNLIEELKPVQLASIKGRLEKIIKQIEKDPLSIADHVLTKTERSRIELELNSYRNSGKNGKTVDQPTTKANEPELKENPTSNTSVMSVLSNTFTWANLLRFTDETDCQTPVTAAATPVSSTNASKETKNSSPKTSENSDPINEILKMLKSIQNDMADTKDSVNLLARRVGVVEDKIDIMLKRSDSRLSQLVAMPTPRQIPNWNQNSLTNIL